MSRNSHCRGRRRELACAAGLGLAALAGAAHAAPTDRQALADALDDEYRAEATYQAVIEKFGEVRPFINIIRAEQRHADMVKRQYARFGMEIPINPYLGKIDAPDSLLEACETGVEAEIENTALYDKLLPTISDPQVRQTLIRLQAASRDNHLPAFQRCVDRGGTPGRGPGGGRGQGGGWGGGRGGPR
jgi:rubrerythrin